MITPTASFKDNLALLPSIEGVLRIELVASDGSVTATIENQAGKQGSLAVYQYLGTCFDALDAQAAAHGLEVFGEHTADAKRRPGAHPNIDLLFDVTGGAAPLDIRVLRS